MREGEDNPVGKIKMYARFVWIYTTSLFLPTQMMEERVGKALKELEESKQRLAKAE